MLADSKIWRQACEMEIKNMKEKGVWTLVERPTNKNVIRGLWLFKVKHNADGSIAKHKAKFMVMGTLRNPVKISTKRSAQPANRHLLDYWLLLQQSIKWTK